MREVSRLFIFLTVFAFSTIHTTAQQELRKPVRVLVDVSKDGGLWWFPQAHTFNANAYHQGKHLADLMRAKGWKVIELPRGEVITFDKLREADIVIRPPAFFNYKADEVSAYQQSVLAGTRLILLGGGATDVDPIAEGFGLRFDSFNGFGSVKQWTPHPLTANIQCCDLPWTPLSEMPSSAVVLASLNQLEPNRLPVLGYLPYGSGYVVFVGNALTHPSLFDSVTNAVARLSIEDIQQVSMGQPVVAERSLEPRPKLIEPISDATLPQPYSAEWRFDWEDVPGAKGYEIVILGRTAVFPLAQMRTVKSEHTIPISQGYIAAHNLLGWSWRVRAQNANGTWGPWSNVLRFNVSK